MQSSINILIYERNNPFIIKQYILRNIHDQAGSMSHDIWRSCDWSIRELHVDVLFGGSEPFFHRILWDVYYCYTILKLYQPVNLMRKGIWFCNELGGGRRRLYSDATGVGLSGSHKEQQTHSGDGIWCFND